MGKKLPETSLEAYRSLDPTKLSEIHRKIIWALSQMEPSTFEEIAAFIKTDKSIVWRRLSELHKQGLIYRPGIKKALRSGRAGYCWTLTDKSSPKTMTQEKALRGRCVSEYARSILTTANWVPQTLF
jgi:predicted transcriptional regulator